MCVVNRLNQPLTPFPSSGMVPIISLLEEINPQALRRQTATAVIEALFL